MKHWARLIAALCCAIAATAHAQRAAPARSADDALIGIWSYQTSFGDALQGELTVAREGGRWHASLAGNDVKIDASGNDLRFGFAGDGGRFRGSLIEDDGSIRGFWIRPGVTSDPRYPGGSSQPFATPMTLARVGSDLWRGTVRPLENTFTLYLQIFCGKEGGLVGAFRNPEQNSIGGATQFRVVRKGDAVHFDITDEDGKSQTQLQAQRVGNTTLRMHWPALKSTIDLTRRTPAAAAKFFPRPPNEPIYAYRAPPDTGDGWITARARDVGLDEAALTRLVRKLAATDPASPAPSLIHSLLVARRGKLVLEEYFFGFDRETTHDLRSAGKTFASVLLGAAMTRGTAVAPETRLYELLASRGPFANPDPRKAQITLAHLMTHTAGFACDDNDDDSPGNEDLMQSQREQPDWWRYTLDLPMAHEPGKRYAYCSANMNLMGAALTTATAKWLPALFDEAVARPLRFGPWHWNLMPNDEGYLGGGAWLRPRDLLKIGQAYLDGGVFRRHRIVTAEWVRQSTAPHIDINPATTGLTAEQFADNYMEAQDAYAWHLGAVRAGKRSYASYAASGNGGQQLIVIPQLELVVVFTGGNYRQGGIWTRWPNEIIGGAIIPALHK